MFPMSIVQTMVNLTNEQLVRLNKSTTTSQELFKYFGIRLNMMRDKPGCAIVDFWMTEQEERSTYVPPNYGRFSMTRHRFQALFRCMRFAVYDEGIMNEVQLDYTPLPFLHHVMELFFY